MKRGDKVILSNEKVKIMLARECKSVAEVAEEMGVSSCRAAAIIRGLSVSPKTAGRVARALNCDITEILADDQTGEA